MVLSRPAVIFIKDHIQNPVQRVLDAPVAADVAGVFPGLAGLAADVVADLRGRSLAQHLSLGYDQGNGLQILPQGFIANAGLLLFGVILPPLDATVVLFRRGVIAVDAFAVRLVEFGGEALLDVLKESLLV